MNQPKPEPSAEAIALLKELAESEATCLCDMTSAIEELQIIDRYLRAAREEAWADAQKHIQQHIESSKEAILECAGKAYRALVNCAYVSRNVHPDKPIAIICDAFGCKPKDECREEFEKVWANLPGWIQKQQKDICFENFKIEWATKK